MSNIAELKNVPEISFIDGISLETVTSQMLADYAAAYAEAAGEQPELAQQFRIISIPTLVVMKDGQIANKAVGAMPKEEILALL